MIDSLTKFVSCSDPLAYIQRDNGSTFINTGRVPVFIGVNDFDGKILVGASYTQLKDVNDDLYYFMLWQDAVVIPADLFFLNGKVLREKDSVLYAPRKDRVSMFKGASSYQAYQNIDNSNDYLLSGQNAIGRTGMVTTYRVYEEDRVTETVEELNTSDYVDDSDHSNVDFTAWENPDIFISDNLGVFTNNLDDTIEVGYATYTTTLNEGEENESIARPQKYIDILFNEEENKWVWGEYSTEEEPSNSTLVMTDENDNTIQLVFFMYLFKFQSVMAYDEGGVK